MEEAATPLPREETTPPVTNIYFGAIRRARAGFYLRDGLLNLRRSDVHTIMGSEERTVKCKVPLAKNRKSNPRRNLFVEMVFINPGEVPARDFRLRVNCAGTTLRDRRNRLAQRAVSSFQERILGSELWERIAACGGFSTVARAPRRIARAKGKPTNMRIRTFVLLGAAFACCSTAAAAQQKPEVLPHENAYSVSRETTLQGKVVAYSATSTTAPMGAHVKVQTSSGVVDVHLGNAHLLAASHLSLAAGDSVSITGENVPFGSGTMFAARVIQKGATSVTLRSRNGMPLVMAPRNASGQFSAPAGAQ
jgi:hypothetical protein